MRGLPRTCLPLRLRADSTWTYQCVSRSKLRLFWKYNRNEHAVIADNVYAAPPILVPTLRRSSVIIDLFLGASKGNNGQDFVSIIIKAAKIPSILKI
jgi:hypothetical protein